MQTLQSQNPNLNIQFEPIVSEKTGQLGALFVIEYYDTLNQAQKHSFIGNQEMLDTLKSGQTEINQQKYLLAKESTLVMIEKYGKLPYLAQLDKQSTVKEISKNPLTDLQNNEFVIIELIENPNHKLAWKDKKAKLHCEPFILTSHIMSELDDAHYHLDELTQMLSLRSDVAFITYTARWAEKESSLLFGPLLGNEEGIGGIINDINHHLEEGDSEPEEKEEINLVFYPTSKNMEQVLFFDSQIDGRKPENLKRKVLFVERLIVRDILGGAKFYIEPPQPEEIPKRKFKH